jgi:hypothetical protein
MWSTGPEATAEIEVGVPSVIVSDVMGNRRQVATIKGVATIKLTPMPLYLIGAKTIRQAAGVKIELRQATVDPSRPRFAVTVTNARSEAMSGTLMVSPESALKIAPAGYEAVTLRPGESRTFAFDATPLAPDADSRLTIRARYKTATRIYEAADALNFHAAPQASPVVGSDISSWPQVSPLVADGARQFRILSGAKPWGGPADISGKLYVAWDASNLYVAARITDDVHVPSSVPGTEFNHDSIELLVDTTRGLRKEAPFQMVTLADFTDHPRVRRYDGPLPKGDITSAKIVVKRIGTETIYEASIPWGEVSKGFLPAVGKTISIAYSIDDHDGGDSGRRCMSWFSTVSDKNATEFGDITLSGPVQSSATSAPAANLLRNGDFEDPNAPPGEHMEGWRVWWPEDQGPRNAECELTAEGAYQGRCLKITRLTGKSNMTVGGWSVPVQPGQIYLFRAMTKLPERSMIAWLRPVDSRGKAIYDLVDPKPLSPATSFAYGTGLTFDVAATGDTTSYHPMDCVFEIPGGGTALQISLAYNWATGSAYVDNCELYLLRSGLHGSSK